MTDVNTGAFTSELDPERTINIRHAHVHVGSKVYRFIRMWKSRTLLAELTKRVPTHRGEPPVQAVSPGWTRGL
jgi:TPP-dependent 2-oxoacid decarboxylase